MHANEPASAGLHLNQIGSFLKVIKQRSCGIEKDSAQFFWDSLTAFCPSFTFFKALQVQHLYVLAGFILSTVAAG